MIILYTLLTSKKCKSQPKTSVFPRKNNPFSIKYSIVWVKISEKKKTKKNITFSGLGSHYNRLANCKKLILPLEKYFKTLKDMVIDTESFTIFQSGWNNGVKLWALDEYPRAFLDKVTPYIDFTDEVVVQCDVPDVKILFLGTGNLQMTTNKFWYGYLWVAYVLFLDPVLHIVLVSLEIEAFNLRSWLHENN